jgi:hypothetical protein
MNLAIAVLGPERPCRGLRPHDAPVIVPELEMNDLEDYTLDCLERWRRDVAVEPMPEELRVDRTGNFSFIYCGGETSGRRDP